MRSIIMSAPRVQQPESKEEQSDTYRSAFDVLGILSPNSTLDALSESEEQQQSDNCNRGTDQDHQKHAFCDHGSFYIPSRQIAIYYSKQLSELTYLAGHGYLTEAVYQNQVRALDKAAISLSNGEKIRSEWFYITSSSQWNNRVAIIKAEHVLIGLKIPPLSADYTNLKYISYLLDKIQPNSVSPDLMASLSKLKTKIDTASLSAADVDDLKSLDKKITSDSAECEALKRELQLARTTMSLNALKSELAQHETTTVHLSDAHKKLCDHDKVLVNDLQKARMLAANDILDGTKQPADIEKLPAGIKSACIEAAIEAEQKHIEKMLGEFNALVKQLHAAKKTSTEDKAPALDKDTLLEDLTRKFDDNNNHSPAYTYVVTNFKSVLPPNFYAQIDQLQQKTSMGRTMFVMDYKTQPPTPDSIKKEKRDRFIASMSGKSPSQQGLARIGQFAPPQSGPKSAAEAAPKPPSSKPSSGH